MSLQKGSSQLEPDHPSVQLHMLLPMQAQSSQFSLLQSDVQDILGALVVTVGCGNLLYKDETKITRVAASMARATNKRSLTSCFRECRFLESSCLREVWVRVRARARRH